MRWGPAAQTDGDFDLVFDSVEQFGTPVELMIAPEPEGKDPIGKKLISGRWSPADDADQADDQSVAWFDWSLGMSFGRIDRVGRGGYSYGLGVDARDPRRLLPAGKVTSLTMPESNFTHAPIRGFQEFGEHIYMVTGPDDPDTATATSDILRVAGSDIDTVVVSGRYQGDTAPYFVGRSIIQYRGYLYIGGYNGMLRRRMADVSQPDLGPHDDDVVGDGSCWEEYSFQRVYLAKQKWRVAGIEDFYLIANDTDYTIVYTASDPTTAGNWSSPVGVVQGDTNVLSYVGDERYRINGVATANTRMWWGKTDGMWDTNSAGISANATPFVEDCLDTANCSALFYHDGYVYFWTSMGFMRMGTNDRVRIDVPQVVQPGFGRPVEGPIYGRVTCNPTSDNGWLVVPIYNGADSFLLYAQDPAALGIDVPVPLIWHGALAHFPGKRITALGKTSLTGWPHLLIGLWDPDAEEASISKMQILKNGSAYQSWQRDDDYRFQTDWSIHFTNEDLGLPNTRKALLRGDATTENTSSANKVEVYTGLDQSVWAEETSTGEPFYVLTPPISGTYTLTVAGYGTTAALAYNATAATIEAALAAIAGLSTDNISVSVHGNRTFRVGLLDLEASALLTASGTASLAYHLMGTALTSPRQAFVPARQTPTGFVINNRIDGTGTATEPAMLTSLKYRLSLIEDQLEEREYTVRVGSGVTNRRGTRDDRDPLALLQKLVSYMSRGALEFVDEHGREISGKIRSGLRYVKVEQDGGYEYRVTFRVKIQRQPFYWGSGAVWSDIYSWSA